MPPSDEPARTSPLFTVFMIIALLAVWGFILDAIHTSRGGSIDLRNRITGIRLASEQRDPYFYKWNRTESDRFCDPFVFPASPVNHTTVTPVTLTAFLPLKSLPHSASQWLWFLVQYSALGFGFQAWARSTSRQNWLWGGLLTCLFCLSPHWRLHLDRGQSYVIYAALFLLLASFSRPRLTRPATTSATPAELPPASRRTLWQEGLTASLLTLLRPTYGLTLGLAPARRKMHAWIATGTGLFVWALLPVLIAGPAIWQNYFKAMSEHSRLYLSQTKFKPGAFAPTETIEGIPVGTFLNFPRIPFSDTSIYKLVSFQLQPGLLLGLLLGLWAALAALSGFLFIRRRQTGTPRFWWALSAWILVGDFLLPAYRYPYNNILLVPLLLLGLSALPTGRARTMWLTLATTILTLHAATWFLPNSFIPWPGIATLLLALGVALTTLTPRRGDL